MTVDDIDWEYLLNTRILHLTGITAALSASCYAVVAEAIRRARAAGVLVSFDVNYRAKLWDAATAGAQLRPLIAEADVLFCKSSDATLLFGCNGGAEGVLGGLRELTRATALYTTFGADGAAMLHNGHITRRPAVPVQIVDRVGSGDAFAAGVLDGILDNDPVLGLERGVALAAIALTQFGDRVLSSRTELEAVMRQGSTDIAR
jgi:2-dehydro-3-deoxygluconokinase